MIQNGVITGVRVAHDTATVDEIEAAGKMAELTGQLRAELKQTEPPETRRAMLRAVVRSPAVWKALHTGIANAKKEAARVMQDHRTGEDT